MRLDQIKAHVQEVTVQVMGEDLKFGYHPAATTPELMEQIAEAAKEAAKDTEDATAGLDLMGQMLEPVLAWWDLYESAEAEAAGQRMGTDAATIKRLPLALTGAVQDAIQKDQRPQGSRG